MIDSEFQKTFFELFKTYSLNLIYMPATIISKKYKPPSLMEPLRPQSLNPVPISPNITGYANTLYLW